MSKNAIELSRAPKATQCCGQNGGASCLWNTQVAPYTLGPMQFSAVLWYQGEQNANCGGPYQPEYWTMLQVMIEDWRAQLGQPDLVFGGVLLAAWESKDLVSFPLLRLAQAKLYEIPAAFVVSTLDLGDPATGAVHSPYKQLVGKRAAWGVAAIELQKDSP